MKNVVSVFLLVAVMSGCVREMAHDPDEPARDSVILTPDEVKLLTERRMSVSLIPDEIDRVVAGVVALLEHADVGDHTRTPVTTTRTPAPRTAWATRPLAIPASGAPATRTKNESAPLFHIVDFADSRGYCIVAADRRLPDPIVCFTGRGSFPAIDTRGNHRTMTNRGLAAMLEAVGVYSDRSLARHVRWSDSVSTALLTRTGAASLDDIPIPPIDPNNHTRFIVESSRPIWQFSRRVGPLLPVEWGQGDPFNATVVENTPWSTTPVGCVALAAVQLMAYWRYPATMDTLGSVDWDELRRWSGFAWDRPTGYGEWAGPMRDAPAETRKLIADILWNVGRRVRMNYTASNSTTYTSRAVALLDTLGFSTGRTMRFSEQVVVGELTAGRPVMIDAASHRHVTGWYDNAHCWVIDGLMEERQWEGRVIDRHIYQIERSRYYLHNNFGWNGSDNGWYVAGVFDPNNDPDLPSNAPTPSHDTRVADEWVGEPRNYQFSQMIYVGIHK